MTPKEKPHTIEEKADVAAEELRTEDDPRVYDNWDELLEAKEKAHVDDKFIFRPKTAVELDSGDVHIPSSTHIEQAEDGGVAFHVPGNSQVTVHEGASLDNDVLADLPLKK